MGKRDLAYIIKKYNKNALRLICYNFRTVNAINFLFSTLYTAPFLYGKIHFGVLLLFRVSIATFDTPLGSNPPLLSVGVINSLQIRFVGREVLYGDTVEQTTCPFSRLIRANVIIPASPYIERNAICPNHWRESSAKMGT